MNPGTYDRYMPKLVRPTDLHKFWALRASEVVDPKHVRVLTHCVVINATYKTTLT